MPRGYDRNNDPNGAQGLARANELYERKYSPYSNQGKKIIPVIEEDEIEKRLRAAENSEEKVFLESLLSLARTMKRSIKTQK
ncbi:MAG: hypothetical protein WAU65_00535 [Candidatus Nanoarchaeia archaeon]